MIANSLLFTIIIFIVIIIIIIRGIASAWVIIHKELSKRSNFLSSVLAAHVKKSSRKRYRDFNVLYFLFTQHMPLCSLHYIRK